MNLKLFQPTVILLVPMIAETILKQIKAACAAKPEIPPQAIAQAVGDKKGIKRYGSFLLPMDESLSLCAIDLSGRPYLNFSADFTVEKLGDFDTEMFREFFYAVSYSAAMNLHLKVMDGGDNHHMAESLFKAFGKALDMATMYEPRIKDVWSTKGSLA